MIRTQQAAAAGASAGSPSIVRQHQPLNCRIDCIDVHVKLGYCGVNQYRSGVKNGLQNGHLIDAPCETCLGKRVLCIAKLTAGKQRDLMTAHCGNILELAYVVQVDEQMRKHSLSFFFGMNCQSRTKHNNKNKSPNMAGVAGGYVYVSEA